MKKFLSTFGKVTIGFVAGGVVTGGGILIYKMLNKEEMHEITKTDAELDFNLNEMCSKESYLGKDGLKLLDQRIRSDLGFGPEIIGLKSINIVEGKYISSDDNGSFIEATKEIFINSTNLRRLVPNSAPLEDKVEVVFQIIFHEYGHYLSSVYVKNNKPTDAVADIYHTTTNGREKSTWNKNFVDKFREYLHYNYKVFYPVKQVQQDGKVFKPLSSVYSSKELFDISNSKAAPAYQKSLENVAFAGRCNSVELKEVESKKLKYLYSIDELFARKFQQTGMVLKNTSLIKNGWISNGESDHVASPFLSDTLKYLPGIGSTYRFALDDPYQRDYKGVSYASKLNALMNDEFGQSNGADISYIVSRNESKMTGLNNYNSIGYGKSIKFGGFLSDGEKYNYVGYKKDGVFHSFKITIRNYTYGYKSALNSQTINKASGETKFYTTDNWIDGDEINGKQLFFSMDKEGSSVIPLTSTRKTSVGRTSNYFFDAPIPVRNYYEAVAQNGIVKIEEGTWT